MELPQKMLRFLPKYLAGINKISVTSERVEGKPPKNP